MQINLKMLKTFEEEVKENKNENESLEPVDIDKSGSDASEEGTHGLSKMFAVLGYCIPNTLRKQFFFQHNTSIMATKNII